MYHIKKTIQARFQWLTQTKIKVQEEEEQQPSIWKQLDIEILRKQIELASIERQEASQNYFKAKNDLLRILDIFLNYCSVNHEKISENLADSQITAGQLVDQLILLRENVKRQSAQMNKLNLHTILYLALIQLSRKNNNTSHLCLNLILEFVIKFNTILPTFNPPYERPNILHSHPSLYQKVWKRIKITPFNQQKIQKDHRIVSAFFHTIIGAIITQNIYDQGIFSAISNFPFLFIKKMINNEKEMLKSLVLIHGLSIEKIKLLSLTETGKMGSMIQLIFPKIQTNQFIYIPSRGHFADNLDIFTSKKDSIPIRILYNRPLPTHPIDQQIQQAFIHIHGGAFVLFSSITTQKYTRYFANKTNMIFFSIEYKLAPQFPFAQSLQDCLQAYRFLTEQLHKYMKIKLKRVFVGGDSSGGTHSCALTALILQEKLKLPNGLFLIYPLLDSRNVFYPSRVYGFWDIFLWPSFTSKCIDAALPTDKDKQNPFASPILLTEQFVGGEKGDLSFPKNWPKTFITVGSKDPLRDECILFMQRMTQAGVDCECRIFQGFKHGYTMIKDLVHGTFVVFSQSAKMLKKMIKQAREDNQ